jgi:hypothetical protein
MPNTSAHIPASFISSPENGLCRDAIIRQGIVSSSRSFDRPEKNALSRRFVFARKKPGAIIRHRDKMLISTVRILSVICSPISIRTITHIHMI